MLDNEAPTAGDPPGGSASRKARSASVEPAPRKRSGPALAALIAGGIGAMAFGTAVVAAEMSPAMKKLLALDNGLGPISGAAALGTVVFLLAWGVLHRALAHREISIKTIERTTRVMLAIGIVLTFPQVVQQLARWTGSDPTAAAQGPQSGAPATGMPRAAACDRGDEPIDPAPAAPDSPLATVQGGVGARAVSPRS